MMVDGVIMSCSSEERFARLKMDAGYPFKASKYCLRAVGARGKDVDLIAFGSCMHDLIFVWAKTHVMLSIQDWICPPS